MPHENNWLYGTVLFSMCKMNTEIHADVQNTILKYTCTNNYIEIHMYKH